MPLSGTCGMRTRASAKCAKLFFHSLILRRFIMCVSPQLTVLQGVGGDIFARACLEDTLSLTVGPLSGLLLSLNSVEIHFKRLNILILIPGSYGRDVWACYC